MRRPIVLQAFRLAERLGMTVGEIMTRMSGRELVAWVNSQAAMPSWIDRLEHAVACTSMSVRALGGDPGKLDHGILQLRVVPSGDAGDNAGSRELGAKLDMMLRQAAAMNGRQNRPDPE